jgi:hypothetical protein
MSLFDHIKKKSAPKPEVQPVATEVETIEIEPEIITVEPELIEPEPTPEPVALESEPEVMASEPSAINPESEPAIQTPEQPVVSAVEIVAQVASKTTSPAIDQRSDRHFSVGIDLGTTHCVLSYADITDIEDDEFTLQVMPIPQLSAPGMVEDSNQLPSFLYQAHESELAENTAVLPWTAKPVHLVGEIARNLGSKTPIRLVSSAKSWLCHAGVDCKSPILPVDAPEEIARISPFAATTAFLQHLCDAWKYAHPNAPLTEQSLVITVPASFDPAARELTVEAARSVGLGQAILLEEPQAALYSWIEKSQGKWRQQAKCGDIILVIDIGGGTTDLSLIAVTEQGGNLELTRVAVGDHILLGGDNMDLALAYTVKAKLEKDGKRLEPWQLQALTHACREAKEKIFNSAAVDTMPIVVANRSSSLIGGNLRTELTRDEINNVLVEGFFPQVNASDRPITRTRTGLRTTGLPYAQDAGITRHLAAFLAKQQGATEDLKDINLPAHATFLHPTAVLFNGGVLKADPLSERLMAVLNSWLSAEQAPEARLLIGADLDLAVARGASYYGFVRKGKGVRIKGGTAAAYYVGVESAMPAVPGRPPELEALCIAPFGMEEGTQQELPDDKFGLVIGEPVRFRFFASTTRRDDRVGVRLDHWTDDEISELDEIEITLPEEGFRPGEVVPVHLCAAVTEVGTLELQAVSEKNNSRWKIELDVRAGD